MFSLGKGFTLDAREKGGGPSWSKSAFLTFENFHFSLSQESFTIFFFINLFIHNISKSM